MNTVPIIFSNDQFVVINKPSGMLSVPGKGEDKADCAVSRIRAMFPAATGPLVIHRLDMDTSGLLVLGLNPESQRDLSMQFEFRKTEKRYIALVGGLVEVDQGDISLPMRADLTNRPYQIVDHDQGRPAQTHFRVMARETDRTRIEFEPITGRSHQLRVHAAAPKESGGLGHPILGDILYGDSTSAPRLMLHATYLSFCEPGGGKRVEFTSPPEF